MGIVEILLIVFGLLDLIFAGYLFFYSDRSISAVFYTLILVFASIWSVSTLLVTAQGIPFPLFKAALSGHYIFGYLAYVSFFWFSLYYPFPVKKYIPFAFGITGLSIFALLFIPFSHFFFISLAKGPTLADSVAFNTLGYVTFVVALSLVFFAGLLMLLWKLREVRHDPAYASINDQQIYFALIANFVAGSLGIVLNLILPIDNDFFFFSVSPILVIVALVGVGLINLIKFKLFNARLVVAELFMVGIWVIFLSRLIVSPNQIELEINVLFFAGAILFGIFLIRSVRAEVHALEKEERLADDLEIRNTQLRELDKQKSEFLSFASHQLRTPLTAIKWSAGAMLDGTFGDVPEVLKEPIQTIFEESSLMALFINDYLNVSRIEQGSMEYRFIPTDMTEILRASVSQLEAGVKFKKLTIELKAPEDRVMVWADGSKLTQVFTNLIDNAMKYTPKGGIVVSLRKDAGKAHIEIKDTGIGMDQETLGKVFDKFVRGENAKQVNGAGSGLGLFIVKTFVEVHKGTIKMDSEGIGKGTTFTLEFPLLIQTGNTPAPVSAQTA